MDVQFGHKAGFAPLCTKATTVLQNKVDADFSAQA